MIHELNSGTVAQGQSLVATVSGQTINGILIMGSVAHDSTDTIQITIKSRLHGARSLCNSISLRTLAELSDLRGGFSQTLKSALTTEVGDTQALYPIRIPLGTLQMEATGSELEIIYRKGQATSGYVGIATYCDDDDIDTVLEYVESRDTRDRFTNVRELYAVSNADLIAYNTKSAQFLVQSPFGQTVSSVPMLMAYSMAALAGEVQAPLRVMALYRSPDPIPDNVEATISGTDASSFTFIAIQVFMDADRVSAGTIQAMDRVIKRVSSKSASEQKALSRGGKAAKLSDLVAARSRMNVNPLNIAGR